MGGQLGRPSGARFRTYERLKRHAEQVKDTLFDSPQLARAIEEIYRYRLSNIAANKRIRIEKLIEHADGWRRFRALMSRSNVVLKKS